MPWIKSLRLVVACTFVGCSGGSDSPPDSGPPPEIDAGVDAFAVGAHESFPQIPDQGGPSFHHPTLVTVSFTSPSGATDQQIQAFGDWIVASDWLTQVGQDYGVGAGTHLHATLDAPTSTTLADSDVQALVASAIQNGSLPSSDAGDGELVYELFFPLGTTISLEGETTCAPYKGDFEGGYHGEVASPHVAYAVVPTCSDASTTESLAAIQSSAAHEFIEASTDPFPFTMPAWLVDDLKNPWTFMSGEVADLCDTEDIQVDGFNVQRVWSNSAAAALTNPCIPAPAEPFYDSTPSPSTVQVGKQGQTIALTLEGFSTAPIGPWQISAFTGQGTFSPTIALSANTLSNGETATLSLTVPSTAAHGAYALVFVDSALSTSDYSFWPVVVEVP